MDKYPSSISRKWGDDGSEDGTKQPLAAKRDPVHTSDDDSENLSPEELQRMHTDMILALTGDGSSVYSGSAVAVAATAAAVSVASHPSAEFPLQDSFTGENDDHDGALVNNGYSYDDRLAQKLYDEEYASAVGLLDDSSPSVKMRTMMSSSEGYEENIDDFSFNQIEHSSEILNLTEGVYSPDVARPKLTEQSISRESKSTPLLSPRGDTKFRVTPKSNVSTRSVDSSVDNSQEFQSHTTAKLKDDTKFRVTPRANESTRSLDSYESRSTQSSKGSSKFRTTRSINSTSAVASYSDEQGPPSASRNSSVTPLPSMRLLRPSQSVSFSKSNARTSMDRSTSAMSVPGAYVVEGVEASGSEDDDDDLMGRQSVIHESDDEDAIMSEEFRVDPLATATSNSAFVMDEVRPPQFHDEERPSSSRAMQEAQVEQAGTLSQRNKHPSRRRRYIMVGVVLVIVVVIAVAVVLTRKGDSGEDSEKENDTDVTIITAEVEDTESPSMAPTVFDCSLQDIYIECQHEGALSFQGDIPDCALQAYQSYSESFVLDIDPSLKDMEMKSCEPQNLAILALAAIGETASIRSKYILNVLYFSTNGHLWKANDEWLSATSECNWFGVGCTDDVVQGLDLAANGLSGTLPTTIGQLDTLLVLKVGNNDLVSPIPAELSNLPSLELLDLSDLSLDTGPFPVNLLRLSTLRILDLSNSDLTGTLPGELSDLSALSGLTLAANKLTGTLPSALFTLPVLLNLVLARNDFTGTIPDTIGEATHMTGIRIERNQLTGTIPTSIGLLTSLADFFFSFNYFSGPIPPKLCSLWNASLSILGGDHEECNDRPSFYGNLSCPSRECCQNCEINFQG